MAGSQCQEEKQAVLHSLAPVCPRQGTGFGSCSAGSAVWRRQPPALVAASRSPTSFPAS